MKRLSVVGGIFASFVLGAAMNAVAQEEHKQQEEHQNQKQEVAQPSARQDQAKPEEHRNQEPQNEQRRQEPRQDERQMQQQQENQRREMQQQEKQQQKMDKQQEKMDRQQGREQEQARPQQPMPNREQARPQHAQNQRRIPEHDFHAHFGREHRFHPGRMQVNGGRPQFSYSGYMFELVEVWPTDWAYDADDYYIDYFDDEYWLCSFSHPEMRLELIIIG